MEREQRHIITFLHLKGCKLEDIFMEFSRLYGSNA
jgi:hypothetical protein